MKTSYVVLASLLIGLLLGAVPTVVQFGLWRSVDSLKGSYAKGHRAVRLDLPGPGEPQPRVAVDEMNYDFGAMERGATLTHKFIFTNEGEGPLKLQLGDTTCKCTLSKLAEDELMPGESAKVELEWTAKTEASEFRQQALIYTNDPDKPRVVLTVSGKVTDSLSIFPHDLIFSNVPIDTEAEGTVRVATFLDEKLEIREHRFADPETADYFEVNVEPIPPEEFDSPDIKRAWRINVRMKPGLPPGGTTQTLQLVTNSKKLGTIEIPILSRISSNVAIIGRGWHGVREMLSLGTIRRSDGKQTKLMILIRGQHPPNPTIRVASVTPDLLHVELGKTPPPAEGGAWKVPLTVEIPKGSPTGVFLDAKQGALGEIILESNHPQAEQIRIPVSFAVIE